DRLLRARAVHRDAPPPEGRGGDLRARGHREHEREWRGVRGAGRRHHQVPGQRAARRAQPPDGSLRDHVPQVQSQGAQVMGHVDRTDKTLPLNEMIFYVRRDARLRERFNTDLEGIAREFGLSREEYEALRDKDVRRLHALGVHQYYVPQILRLFYG